MQGCLFAQQAGNSNDDEEIERPVGHQTARTQLGPLVPNGLDERRFGRPQHGRGECKARGAPGRSSTPPESNCDNHNGHAEKTRPNPSSRRWVTTGRRGRNEKKGRQSDTGECGRSPGSTRDGLTQTESSDQESQDEFADEEGLDEAQRTKVKRQRLEDQRTGEGQPSREPKRLAKEEDHKTNAARRGE